MAKSTLSGLRAIGGLIVDCVKLGCTTANAGIRITGEASAKARPHVQGLTARIEGFTLDRVKEAKESGAPVTALLPAPAQQ